MHRRDRIRHPPPGLAALRPLGRSHAALLPLLPAARAIRPSSSPAANGKNPDPQVVENIREKYGFDEPIIVQYGKYLGRLVTFDFGTSYRDGEPVNDIIKEKAPASLRLAFWAIIIETVVGIGAGVLAAVRKYSIADTVTTLLAAILSAIPVFVLAYFIQQVTGVMAYKHGWPEWASFPVQGIGPERVVLRGASRPRSSRSSTWSSRRSCWPRCRPSIVARLTRTTMLEVGKLPTTSAPPAPRA